MAAKCSAHMHARFAGCKLVYSRASRTGPSLSGWYKLRDGTTRRPSIKSRDDSYVISGTSSWKTARAKPVMFPRDCRLGLRLTSIERQNEYIGRASGQERIGTAHPRTPHFCKGPSWDWCRTGGFQILRI